MHLIMFDIDGTLINSNKFDEDCYIKTARTVLGIDISSNWEEYPFATDSGILDEIIRRYRISGNKKIIHQNFRHVFTQLISEHISINPDGVKDIIGAARFIKHLQKHKNVKVAIATGGWEETAKLKLKAARIDFNRCAFASSSDHYDRSKIMEISESRAIGTMPFKSKTYFGDASWDKKASNSLNYRFILVGNRIKNEIQIDDYQDQEFILSILSL